MRSLNISTSKVLLYLISLTMPSITSAQTFYALQIDRNIRFEAVDITSEYQPRLVMGANQALEFQSTVARFLVKKKAVEEDPNLSEMAKYQLLKRISSRESSEMADVLEPYRWQEYLRIKPDIQPIVKPASSLDEIDALAVLDSTKQ